MSVRIEESPSTPDDGPRPAGSAAGAAPGEISPGDRSVEEDRLVEEDLLVEDVSIDGMCGVY